MKKNTILLSLIIALILTLGGCRVDFDSDDPQSETDNMKTITIGALLPLTGNWSEPGQGAKKALDVTLSMVNYFLKPSELKFELDIRDTESNGEKALQELSLLHDAGIDTVIGPMSSEACVSVLDYANENSVLLLSPSATSEELALDDNLFRVIGKDRSVIEGLTTIMKDKYEYDRLITVYLDDAYGRGYYATLQDVLPSMGMETAGTIALSIDSADHAAIVDELEGLAAGENIEDTAILLVCDGKSASDLIKNISSASKLSTMKWFVSVDIIGSTVFMEDSFVEAFAAKTKMEGLAIGYRDVALDALPYIATVLDGAADISPYAISTWDCLWLLAKTYKEAPAIDTDTLKKTLVDEAGRYRNAFGAISLLDENGDIKSSRYMRYMMYDDKGSYSWRCLGHYVNLGVGDPIIQTIEWRVSVDGGIVQVGALLPLTGSIAEKGGEIEIILEHSAASFNQYASDMGSDLRIELVVEDTGSDPETAAFAAQKLVDMGIRTIIGPIGSSELEAVKPLSDSYGDIFISPLSSSPSLSLEDRIYRLMLNDTHQAHALCLLLTEKGISSLIIINRNDTYGNELADAVAADYTGKITRLTYDIDQSDFSTILTKAGAALSYDTGHTAVLVVAHEEIVDILKQVGTQSRLNDVSWFGTDSSALSNLLINDPDAAEKASSVNFTAFDYSPYGPYFDPLYHEINSTFQPDEPFKESSLGSFDGLWLLCCAYLIHGASADLDTINNYISGKSFRGVGGVLSLDAYGDRQFGYYKLYHLAAGENGEYSWENNGIYNLDYTHSGILELFD